MVIRSLPYFSLCLLMAMLITGCAKKALENKQDPVISSIVPMISHGGDTIVAHGSNFPADRSQISLSLNNKPLSILNASPDSVQAVVPMKAGSGKIVMSVSGKTFVGPEFTYDPKVVVTTIAGNGQVGAADGAGLGASFNCPWGIACAKNGDLFVADCYNRLIRKISAADFTVSSFSIPTLVNGQNFYSPYNLAIDSNTNNLFVTDFNLHLMRMDPAGNMTSIYTDSMPLTGIAVSPDGMNLYISNNTAGTIVRTDINGNNKTVFTAGLTTPRNLIFDSQGQLFVAAYPASVYSISNTGIASPYSTDPEFQGWEMAKDTSGNIYLADHFKNRIRKIDPSGNVTTIAGSGNAADIDGIGLDASFDGPQGITMDAFGNLYITTFNYNTNTGNRVRKVSFQ